MNFKAFFLMLGGLAVACGGKAADTAVEPEPEIPTNVPSAGTQASGRSSSGHASESGATAAAEASTCGSDDVDGYGCVGGQSVTTAEEGLAIARKQPSQQVSIAKSAGLFVSADIVAASDIQLDAADLDATDCVGCQVPYFRAAAFPRFEAVPGVTCIEPGERQPIVRIVPACTRLAIAKGTTFRVRRVVQDLHPTAPTYWSFVDIVPACTTACPAGQVLCATSHQCFAAGAESCAYCDGEAPAVCACRVDRCHDQPRGTACSFASSPDVEESGTCAATGCVRK